MLWNSHRAEDRQANLTTVRVSGKHREGAEFGGVFRVKWFMPERQRRRTIRHRCERRERIDGPEQRIVNANHPER